MSRCEVRIAKPQVACRRTPRTFSYPAVIAKSQALSKSASICYGPSQVQRHNQRYFIPITHRQKLKLNRFLYPMYTKTAWDKISRPMRH